MAARGRHGGERDGAGYPSARTSPRMTRLAGSHGTRRVCRRPRQTPESAMPATAPVHRTGTVDGTRHATTPAAQREQAKPRHTAPWSAAAPKRARWPPLGAAEINDVHERTTRRPQQPRQTAPLAALQQPQNYIACIASTCRTGAARSDDRRTLRHRHAAGKWELPKANGSG